MAIRLIVAATEAEIKDFLNSSCNLLGHNLFQHLHNPDIHVLITGMGIANMSLHLSRYLATHDVSNAINAGFCGSFNHELPPGTAVNVISDCFAELGVSKESGKILPLESVVSNRDILHNLNMFVQPDMQFLPEQLNLPDAKGITVSTCTNDVQRASYMKEHFSADIESMEGAAFYLTCNAFVIPCLQLRTVSNLIPGREPEHWNMKLAAEELQILFDNIIL
jgi:futalosine hydrolase